MTMPPPGPARRTGPQLAPLLIAAAVAVVLAGAVLLWLTGFNPGSLLDDKRLNTVLTVLTTAIGAAVKLVRRRTPPESTDRLDLAHRELTERLARLYRIEAVDTGLLGPRMGVRWRILPVQDSPRDTTVLPAWFRVRPERRLVILGGPGSGKRSAALLIALDLLAGRGPDSIRATPVLLGVGGWDPARRCSTISPPASISSSGSCAVTPGSPGACSTTAGSCRACTGCSRPSPRRTGTPTASGPATGRW